ncbi:unnamed protein product [Camellia sinensis]
MLGKKISSVKKLAKKVKVRGNPNPSQKKCLLQTKCDDHEEEGSSSPPQTASPGTPTGHFAVYVGEERRRFVVPIGFLSHPLFKMLLEKAYDEFGFEQRAGLVVPCSVAAFQEVKSWGRASGCSGGGEEEAKELTGDGMANQSLVVAGKRTVGTGVKDLLGFYFDAEKNRYFPIKGPIPGSSRNSSSASTSYSSIQVQSDTNGNAEKP